MAGDDDDDQPSDARAVVDAGSADGVANQRKKIRNASQQANDCRRAVFAEPVGRREMYQILLAANAFGTPFATAGGFPQPEATWSNAGRRDFGLRLYHEWMLHDFDGVKAMLEENDAAFMKAKEDRK